MSDLPAQWQFVITVAAAAIGSAITIWFTGRETRAQRWWDKKAEIYLSIVEAFHPLLDEALEYEEAMEFEGSLAEVRKIELRTASRKALESIRKLRRLGKFLISDEAEHALLAMDYNLERATETPDLNDHLLRTSEAVWNGFDAIKLAAANDLGVKPHIGVRIARTVKSIWKKLGKRRKKKIKIPAK